MPLEAKGKVVIGGREYLTLNTKPNRAQRRLMAKEARARQKQK